MSIIAETDDDKTIRILHVDDEPDFAEMASAFLQREDERFEVETASSASDGLSCLADASFDCVISDYDMPTQDGIEFLKTLREDHPNIPFILYTGKGSERVASDAFSSGATEYLQKDTGTDHFRVLANRIKTLVDRARSEQREKRLVEAVETAREGIGILDEDGYHISANQAYADMYQMTPDSLIGTHWTKIYPQEQIESVRTEISPTIEAIGYWHGRTTGLRSDGTTFAQDCALSTTAEGMTIRTVRDASDQIESEEQLSRYQAFMRAIEDPVYVLDEKGRFEFVNEAFVETFGYEQDEILGKDVSIIKDETAVEQGENNLGRILSSDGGDSIFFETEIQTKSGNSVLCEDHMTVLPYEGEYFNGSAGILRDISEQKKRERELKRQNERLDEFTSVVSHDLRNPLSVIEGNVELLSEEFASERIESIQRSLTRMNELIDDLLELSRVGDNATDKKSVSLAELFENCWQSVETSNATLNTKTNHRIQADRSRVKQLCENLVRNAIEHNEQDVTITVGELADGFYVEDDGSGIPENERDDVLEAGYSTTEEGTGFGLSIVKQVVDAHGWGICVTESSEGGARFEIINVDFESV